MEIMFWGSILGTENGVDGDWGCFDGKCHEDG